MKKYILLLALLLSFNPGVLAATLTSVKLEGYKIVLDTFDLDKLQVKGNNTNEVSIILPDTKVANSHNINTYKLLEQLKRKVNIINSFEILQNSKMIVLKLKADIPISPQIGQNKKNQIVIDLSSVSKPQNYHH